MERDAELADVRAYARRPWAAMKQREHEHWAREISERGPLVTLAASQALWLHMRRVRPDWPTEADRDADLAHHIALKQALDRAARVLAPTAGR